MVTIVTIVNVSYERFERLNKNFWEKDYLREEIENESKNKGNFWSKTHSQ